MISYWYIPGDFLTSAISRDANPTAAHRLELS